MSIYKQGYTMPKRSLKHRLYWAIFEKWGINLNNFNFRTFNNWQFNHTGINLRFKKGL